MELDDKIEMYGRMALALEIIEVGYLLQPEVGKATPEIRDIIPEVSYVLELRREVGVNVVDESVQPVYQGEHRDVQFPDGGVQVGGVVVHDREICQKR